jgi:pSer/pThr/pTyr-binding forkhead associated (FHA) protein
VLIFSAGRPFVIDLESTNKTFVNDEVIPAARYYELKTGDGMLLTTTGNIFLIYS